LTCNDCKKQYVGQTKRSFRLRFKEHLRDIINNRPVPVAEHINSHSDPKPTITPAIIEVINMDPDSENSLRVRLKREKLWMLKLKTLVPYGMNTLDK